MQLKKQCVDFLKAAIDKSAALQLQYLHNRSPHFVHMGVNDIKRAILMTIIWLPSGRRSCNRCDRKSDSIFKHIGKIVHGLTTNLTYFEGYIEPCQF